VCSFCNTPLYRKPYIIKQKKTNIYYCHNCRSKGARALSANTRFTQKPRDPEKYITATCKICGKVFQYWAVNKSGKYCSWQCYLKDKDAQREDAYKKLKPYFAKSKISDDDILKEWEEIKAHRISVHAAFKKYGIARCPPKRLFKIISKKEYKKYVRSDRKLGISINELYGDSIANQIRKKMSEEAKIMRRNKIIPFKDTKPEKLVQNALLALNIKFVKQKLFVLSEGDSHQTDFFIEPNICIEVDGDYWHNLPKKKMRDAYIDKCLKEQGNKVVRIWEHEILKGQKDDNLCQIIQKALDSNGK
jgi:very-short-patch-repair endonuclease